MYSFVAYDKRKCNFREWLYGPTRHWPEPETKEKKNNEWPKECESCPVLSKCGVEADGEG
jgi:hypothetical protein